MNGVPISFVRFYSGYSCICAVIEMRTQKQADTFNRMINNLLRCEERAEEKSRHYCWSLDDISERGFVFQSEEEDPLEIIVREITYEALHDVLDLMTEEQRRICRMIVNNDPQRKVADELGIPRRTLRDRKDKVISELSKKMRHYKD